MRLLDRDAASDSAIKTSIFALLSETGRFSDEELQVFDIKVGTAIKDARARWLAEELPLIGP